MTGARKVAVAAVLVFVSCMLATVPQQRSALGQETTETKVTEVRERGRYKRITETFVNGELVSRRVEVSTRDDGEINLVFVKCFRNGKMVFASTLDKMNNRNVTIRSYHHEGKCLVMEGDEDGDGFFETLMLVGDNGIPVEGFERSKDGTVTPMSEERLSKIKKEFEVGKGD
jgi:hypothetical protein